MMMTLRSDAKASRVMDKGSPVTSSGSARRHDRAKRALAQDQAPPE